jgi:Holliday junction resolvasome RuvABC endonuclease subunit
MACDLGDMKYKRVAASTLKKYATGNGRADKPAMYAAAKARGLDKNVASDDEVDALWVLDYALHELV